MRDREVRSVSREPGLEPSERPFHQTLKELLSPDLPCWNLISVAARVGRRDVEKETKTMSK